MDICIFLYKESQYCLPAVMFPIRLLHIKQDSYWFPQTDEASEKQILCRGCYSRIRVEIMEFLFSYSCQFASTHYLFSGSFMKTRGIISSKKSEKRLFPNRPTPIDLVEQSLLQLQKNIQTQQENHNEVSFPINNNS